MAEPGFDVDILRQKINLKKKLENYFLCFTFVNEQSGKKLIFYGAKVVFLSYIFNHISALLGLRQGMLFTQQQKAVGKF